MNKLKIAVLAAYLVAAIITFGFSYNHDYDESIAGLNGHRALLCGVFWPLYFSKVAFEGYRK